MPVNQKYCPSCGASNPQDVVFCISCGSKFPQMTSQPSAAYPLPSMPTSAPSFPQTNTPTSRSDFITLSCPNCGGRLQITPDIERFACPNCGMEHIIKRSGGTISLEQVMRNINAGVTFMGSGINRLGMSAERQAAEQTINRLKAELEELNTGFQKFASSQLTTIFMSGTFFVLSLMISIELVVLDLPGWILIIGFAIAIPCLIIFIGAIKKNSNRKHLMKQIADKKAELDRYYQIVQPK